MHAALLHDIGLCVVTATGMAFVARLLRQPLILAYIGAGLIIGPPGFKWIQDQGSIAQISELGLAFLLFIVGLEIDLKHLIRSGKVAGIVGTVQVVVCAFMGWVVARMLGYSGLPALYIGAATAFSSTMIVVKLLSDRSELDTTSGRIVLGVLLVQDVLAIVVLAIQPNLNNPSFGPLMLSMVKGFGLVAGAFFASRFILPTLFRLVAKSPEVILIAAISWCFLLSFAAMKADFSIAMGALIAGVSIAAFPYSLDVVAKIRSLRDFFVTLFFVSLGMQITIGSKHVFIAAGAITLVTVLGRFIPIMPTMRAMRYGHRVGILSSIALGQVSEFSLVIVALGMALGHVNQELSSVIALALVATSTISTYFIQASHPIASKVSTFLHKHGFPEPAASEAVNTTRHRRRTVILGCHRTGSSLVPVLTERKRDFTVVDFSPEVLDVLRRQGVEAIYGDLSHPDTLEHAGLHDADIVISTVSDDFLRGTSNLAILKQVKHINPAAKVIVAAERLEAAKAMYAAGADYVILPRHVSASNIADLLPKFDDGSIAEMREAEIVRLRDLKEVVA